MAQQIKISLSVYLLFFLFSAASGQEINSTKPADTVDKNELLNKNLGKQKDLIDVWDHAFRKNSKPRTAGDSSVYNKPHLSILPAVGYTLQTDFAAVFAGNLAFYTSKKRDENVSSILASVTYSQYQQTILPLLASIWTARDDYNIVLDWKYLNYPSITYGLGSSTNVSDGYSIDYQEIHLNQTVFRKIVPDVYFGLGYRTDHFWNIKEIDPPAGKITDFESYGLTNTSTASGFTLNFLYDDRRNAINPLNGDYLNISYWLNSDYVGSDANWSALILDYRKYIQLPTNSHNVLAFWSYDWMTVGGTPPYLLLPSTGSDPQSNSGRGYIQGRFRGSNMLYAESEYRFVISKNELLGGVVFVNAQSFSQQPGNLNFGTVAPGVGLGIRLKANKFSRTNIALDYGFGSQGSGGFFVNLGEVF